MCIASFLNLRVLPINAYPSQVKIQVKLYTCEFSGLNSLTLFASQFTFHIHFVWVYLRFEMAKKSRDVRPIMGRILPDIYLP